MAVLSCDRFVDQALAEELKCGICLNVFTNAVDTQCRDTFCYECLNRMVNSTSSVPKCPQCRHRLTDDWRTNGAINANNVVIIGGRVLVDKNRKVNAMVAKLNIRCDYASNGCREVCPLESLSTHTQSCPHRLCATCDLSLAGQTTLDGHNCLDELKRDRNKWQEKCVTLETKCSRLRSIAEESIKVVCECRQLCRLMSDDNTVFSAAITRGLATAWKAVRRATYVIITGGTPHQFELDDDKYRYLFDN